MFNSLGLKLVLFVGLFLSMYSCKEERKAKVPTSMDVSRDTMKISEAEIEETHLDPIAPESDTVTYEAGPNDQVDVILRLYPDSTFHLHLFVFSDLYSDVQDEDSADYHGNYSVFDTHYELTFQGELPLMCSMVCGSDDHVIKNDSTVLLKHSETTLILYNVYCERLRSRP